MVTHNENGFSAASNTEGIIVVWQQYEGISGPSLDQGKLICIVLNKFKSIKQLQWIIGNNELLIHEGIHLHIWNIFLNEEIAKIEFKERVFFAKTTQLGRLIVSDKGKAILFDNRIRWSYTKETNLILNTTNGVLIYPTKFTIEEGKWKTKELDESSDNRRMRRRIENDNKISIKGEVYYTGTPNLLNLTIDKSHHSTIKKSGLISVYQSELGYIINLNKRSIFVDHKKLITITIPDTPIVGIDLNRRENYVIVRSPEKEFKISYKFDKPIVESLTTIIKNHELLLDRVPLSMFLDYKQDLLYTRVNFQRGYIFFPDFQDDQLFIDLMTREGSVFSNIDRNRNYHIEVEENGKYILDWRRGKSYPSGTLFYRNITHPENEPIILYNEEVTSKRITTVEFSSDETIKFPIIIPSWNKIELWGQTDKLIGSQFISLSQYFYMLQELSSKNEINDFIFSDDESDSLEIAFIKFARMKFTHRGKNFQIDKIYPLWTINKNSDLVAFVSEDLYCYVMSIKTEILIPICSFPTKFPLHLKISNDGLYLILTYFVIKETKLKIHPNYQNKYLSHNFPYIVFEIRNLQTNKVYSKSLRFPHRVTTQKIALETTGTSFHLSIPSYTDMGQSFNCIFNTIQKKFNIENTSLHKRYWNTFSLKSPFSMHNKGEEFPLVKHPEIYRDYTRRPGHIFKYQLVRKTDDFIISDLNGQLIKVDQFSSHELYNLKRKSKIELPFYYSEIRKILHIDSKFAKYIQGHTRHPLEKIDKLPSNFSIKLDLTISDANMLRRIDKLISKILESKEVHSGTGISYESNKFDIYKSQLEILQESIDTAIDFIREV